MGFSGQVHDRLGLGGGEGPAHGLGVADIGLDEGEARLALQVSKGGQIARVGELIDDRDGMAARDQKTGQIRPDEARAAGDQNTHKQWAVISRNKGGEARKKAGDVVAGDTLARGHVDKGETRVSGMEYRSEKDPRAGRCHEVGRALRARRTDGPESRPHPLQPREPEAGGRRPNG